MKKILIGTACAAALGAVVVWAQSITQTTNLGLNLIPYGYQNWHTPLNANTQTLDSYIGAAKGSKNSIDERLDVSIADNGSLKSTALSLPGLSDVDDTMTPTANQYLQYNGTKWTAGTVVTPGDEYVKVGIGGTPDYLNVDYFERDASNHIRPKARINNGGTGANDLWSGAFLAGGTGTGVLKQNNYHGKVLAAGNKSTTYAIPMNAEAIITVNVTGNLTLSATSIPADGYAAGVVVILTSSDSYTLSYDSNWKWSGGRITSITSSDTIALSLLNYGNSASNVIATTSYLSTY